MKSKKKPLDEQQLNIFAEFEERKLTDEQKSFIDYNGKSSVVLSAVAGSGKTFSCVERLKKLINSGVDPSKIIFFSFTNAATEELKKRMGRDDVKITTIHAYCSYILYKTNKFKNITNFYDFIKWYKEKNTPSAFSSKDEILEFNNNIHEMYEDSEMLSSKISTYKLLRADNIKSPLPLFFIEYEQFQKQTFARDFADMLIEVYNLFKDNRYLKMFKDKYEYIFVDEFQDTSTIQLKILMALNAKFYYLIGDLYQNIFAYSGTSAKELITMLADRRPVEEMTLTVNFRSDINIVENSNNFTELKAIPNSSLSGSIENNIITDIDSLISILDTRSEVAILVRTNAVITQLEKKLLSIRYPMNYINYFKDKELEELKNEKLNPILSKKWSVLSPFYSSKSELIAFIKSNKTSRKFITTIHKSKGREFDCCVVVNSIAPTVLLENGYNLPKKEFKKISFDEQEKNDLEPRNIHYVAVTRAKHELFYMLWGNV